MARTPLRNAIAAGLAAGSVAASRADGQDAPSRCLPHEQLIALCAGVAPAVGESFSGPVLEVLDERTLCVAQGPTPDQWIRVELPAHAAPGGRPTLLAVSFGKRATCVTRRVLDQGVVGDCLIDGVPLAELMRDPVVETRAADWR